MSDQVIIRIVTHADETTVQATTKRDDGGRARRIARLEISPVAVGNEGDELLTSGQAGSETDVILGGLIDGGTDLTRGGNTDGRRFQFLESVEELIAVTRKRRRERPMEA